MGLFLFLQWLLFFAAHLANALNPSIPNDALSLFTFKRFVSSDPLNLLSEWSKKASENLCSWHGVTCGGAGILSSRVTALNVTGLGGGELAPSIGDLSELRVLSIPGNMFSGQIPASLGKLRRLKVLELQGDNISGRVPNEMGYLQSLSFVNLSCNALSGSIPSELYAFTFGHE